MSTCIRAQHEYRTGLSGFYLPEKGSLNIGFTSLEAQTRLLTGRNIDVDFGMRFIGATTGRRGGYFAFGYYSDFILRTQSRLQPGLNVAFLAGGGAAAPDNDGWLLQGNAFLQYQFKNGFAARGGINYGFVSGGIISGFSPVLGVNWRLKTTNGRDSLPERIPLWRSAYAESGIGISGKRRIVVIGAGAGFSMGRYFCGDLAIHALTNVHGGYMQSLLSGGPDLSFGAFHFKPAVLLGLGGGGGVPTVGGGLYGLQAGLDLSAGRFYTGLKYQFVESVSGYFGYQGVFVSIGKALKGADAPELAWDLVAKAYVGKYGFGNIGARLVAVNYRKLRLMGSTYWAFTHDMGAYAEGLFEATLDAPRDFPLYVVGSIGAGAGSGINQRKAALMYGGGAGVISPWVALPVRLECAYWRGGNVPGWSISLSYSIGKKKSQ